MEKREAQLEAGKPALRMSHKIQILRGLAIIAVVFIHNTPGGLSQVVIRPFLNFCVGLFLFLSGMMSDARRWNPGKRVAKVLIPYGVWTLIYVVLLGYPPIQRPKSLVLVHIYATFPSSLSRG